MAVVVVALVGSVFVMVEYLNKGVAGCNCHIVLVVVAAEDREAVAVVGGAGKEADWWQCSAGRR